MSDMQRREKWENANNEEKVKRAKQVAEETLNEWLRTLQQNS